ncbi:MAG: DNA methyltransferase [Chloroflexota bacterium]
MIPRQSIERDFPLEPLSQLAELESWRKEVNRPTYYVHKWWARRLGSVFRAILLGTLLDESESVWPHFYRQHDFHSWIILDPFMGGGTTLGEAVKLGCRVVGSDVNPVAWYLVRSALQRVSPSVLQQAFARLERDVAPRLQHYYCSIWHGQPAEILYTFWVKTIHCPTCQAITRLFPAWIFAKNAYPARKPEAHALCPRCGHIDVIRYDADRSVCGACGCVYNPQIGPAKRTTFVCESCHTEHPIAETYRLTSEPPAHQMYALRLLLPDGRKVYKQPDAADLALYAQAAADWEQARSNGALYPQQAVPAGVNTNQARGYNYHYWHQMFNPRQLLCLSTLLEGILREPNQVAREQLLLLFSGILEFNNLFCSYKGEGTGAVRPLFSHHILKPERTPLENNPWGTPKSSGSYSTLFWRRLLAAQEYADDPFELRVARSNGHVSGEKVHHINQPLSVRFGQSFADLASERADALILAEDSAHLPLPDASVDAVVTDPPYFDNVHYSELADFFYAWLKLALDGREPSFASDSSRHPAEVQNTDPQAFATGLAEVLSECRRVLKPGGLLVFTFQHAREEAWLALCHALQGARWRIVAVHPIKAEMAVATPKSQAAEPINIDVIFVCRSANEQAITNNPSAIEAILSPTHQQAARLVSAGLSLSRGDLFVIAMSQFVACCTQSVSASGPVGLSDEQAALLTELRAALPGLSIVNTPTFQDVPRQLRLLDEAAVYGTS